VVPIKKTEFISRIQEIYKMLVHLDLLNEAQEVLEEANSRFPDQIRLYLRDEE
jgi:hypothetical protein